MPAEQPRLSDQFRQEVEGEHQLNHVQTHEKNVLPTQKDVEQEKQHLEFKKGIEEYDSDKMHHVKTEEKAALPTQEQINQEKLPQLAANFNHEKVRTF